jgi:anti-sigma B factor antagonist
VELDVTARPAGDFTVLEVAGEIDMDSAPQLRERVLEQVAAGTYRLIIDMSGVTFMDSSGLSVLVAALKRVSDNEGELRLVITRERTMKLFRITSLDSVFGIHASVQDALDGIPLSEDIALPT